MADSAAMSHPGGGYPFRRARRPPLSALSASLVTSALLVASALVAAPAWAAAPPVTAPATTAATTTTAPATTPTTATAAVPPSSISVAGVASPVAVPGIPALDPQWTDGQSPSSLLTRALALSSVGASQAPLEANLADAEATLTAQSVLADQASAAAAGASAAAAAAAARSSEATREAADLQGALRTAAINMYTGGTASMSLAPSVDDLDHLGDAAAYEDSVLSPDGILASRHAEVRAAAAALATRRSEQAAATADAARSQAALASAAAATARIRAELDGLTTQAATLVAAEHTDVSDQAAQALTGPGALEFTPSSPLPAPLATTSVALSWIFSELGKPYLWGGTGPDAFDCSGLTQYVWDAAGVQIPRVAQDQEAWTVPVPLSQLLPGDLVFFGTSTDIHHVGMYIGDGLMVNAPHTGTDIQVSPIWWSDLYGFGRVHSSGVAVPARPLPPGLAATPAVVATVGAVPSESTPPPGYVAPPGATSPVGSTTGAGAVTTTTAAAGTTTTTPAPTTTTVPVPSVPGSTTTTVGNPLFAPLGAPTTTPGG